MAGYVLGGVTSKKPRNDDETPESQLQRPAWKTTNSRFETPVHALIQQMSCNALISDL